MRTFINQTKPTIWASDVDVRNNLPENLKPCSIATVKILGTRTQIALREGGAALNLGDPTDDDLPKVVEDLAGLLLKIQDLTEAELGVSVGHRLWQYTAMASVVHLMSNQLYGLAELEGLTTYK